MIRIRALATHLENPFKDKIDKVLQSYAFLFANKTIGLGRGATVKHAIHITGTPIAPPLRRLAHSLRPIVKQL
jgi:hypothetical protein